jgi:hypothetical protein
MIKNIRLWRRVKVITAAGQLLDHRLLIGPKLRARENIQAMGLLGHEAL